MLRATPGWRLMNPSRSSVSTIWRTEGGLTGKYAACRVHRGTPVQPGIGIDKCQVLALLLREGFSRATHLGHPIQLFIRASIKEAGMNVRYRVELSQTERNSS